MDGTANLREGTLGEDTVKKQKVSLELRLPTSNSSNYLHEQAGLATGAVPYDDEFATDFGHDVATTRNVNRRS